MRGRLALLLVALVAIGALAGCGGGTPRSPADAPPEQGGLGAPVLPALDIAAADLPRFEPAVAGTANGGEKQGCVAGDTKRMRSSEAAYAALAKRRIAAYARPGGKRLQTFDPVNVNGYRTVFGILGAILDDDCKPAWYKVQLPIRPNGSTGYVRASAVEVAKITTRIDIDISKRRLELFQDGQRTLAAAVAVGADITPTPPGSYYVNQRLVAPDPWGPYGPAALGISGFSPTLVNWTQGGPLAIHGTNDPSSIGQAASHGCVRVPNDVLLVLFEKVPAGTPVEIHA